LREVRQMVTGGRGGGKKGKKEGRGGGKGTAGCQNILRDTQIENRGEKRKGKKKGEGKEKRRVTYDLFHPIFQGRALG